jgi:hypothetical protein
MYWISPYFNENSCTIIDKKKNTLIKVLESNNVYPLTQDGTSNFMEQEMTSMQEWHYRLGHLGQQNMILLKDQNLVADINFKEEKELFCKACLKGKQHQQPFPQSHTPNSTDQTKARSPIAYYVPAGALALPLLAVLTVTALRQHTAGAPYIVSACGFVLLGGALTVYIVRSINLELFFEPPADLVRAGRLLAEWQMLNYLRLTLSLASIVMMILWTRTVIAP